MEKKMIPKYNYEPKERKILFICLPSTIDVFKESKISVAIPLIPLISLAQLSAVSRQEGYEPSVLDLSVKKKESTRERIIKAITEIKPEYCGITFTTPLSEEAENIAAFIKKINKKIKLIAGGPHATLEWDTINRYYNLFYRKTMLNPGFLLRRVIRDIKTGELFLGYLLFYKNFEMVMVKINKSENET